MSNIFLNHLVTTTTLLNNNTITMTIRYKVEDRLYYPTKEPNYVKEIIVNKIEVKGNEKEDIIYHAATGEEIKEELLFKSKEEAFAKFLELALNKLILDNNILQICNSLYKFDLKFNADYYQNGFYLNCQLDYFKDIE